VKERRGACPICLQIKAVTARGVMRMHWPPRDGDRRQFREHCAGTAQPPRHYTDGGVLGRPPS
jgi:hypothetical protein